MTNLRLNINITSSRQTNSFTNKAEGSTTLSIRRHMPNGRLSIMRRTSKGE
jgi:hypothetical protein